MPYFVAVATASGMPLTPADEGLMPARSMSSTSDDIVACTDLLRRADLGHYLPIRMLARLYATGRATRPFFSRAPSNISEARTRAMLYFMSRCESV